MKIRLTHLSNSYFYWKKDGSLKWQWWLNLLYQESEEQMRDEQDCSYQGEALNVPIAF